MFYVFLYDYINKSQKIISKGNKRDMIEFIESYMIDYINNNQRFQCNHINDIIKNKGELLSTAQLNGNIEYFANKTDNIHKYTVKKAIKNEGYVYTSYYFNKVFSIYLIEDNLISNIELNKDKFVSQFIELDNYYEVIKEFKNKTRALCYH